MEHRSSRLHFRRSSLARKRTWRPAHCQKSTETSITQDKAAMRRSMLWAVVLIAVVQTVTAVDTRKPAGLFEKVKSTVMGWHTKSKEKNREYSKGACWRKFEVATNGACPDGFYLRWGSFCSSSCPLEKPVRCGPVCLPAGRSCVHEAVKKVGVAGLVVAKATGYGAIAERCYKVITQRVEQPNTEPNDQSIEEYELTPIPSKAGTGDGALCDNTGLPFSQLSDEELAELINALAPMPRSRAALRSRSLMQPAQAANCAAEIYKSVEKFLAAVVKTKTDGLSTEVQKAYAEVSSPVAKAVLACKKQAAVWGPMLASAFEAAIEALIDRVHGGMTPKQALEDFALNALTKANPYGAIWVIHEYVQEVCPDATITEFKYDKAMYMGKHKKDLGLQGTGVVVASPNSKWDPTAKASAVTISVLNQLKFEVALYVYSGGRSFKHKGDKTTGTTRMKIGSNKEGTLTVPLDELSGEALYIDVIAEKNVWQQVKATASAALNDAVRLATVGLSKPLIEELPTKLGSIVFWVPDTNKGEMTVITQLAA